VAARRHTTGYDGGRHVMYRGNEQEGHGSGFAGVPSGHVDEWDEQIVVDYLDGRLAPEGKAAVKRHLQECPDCADRVQAQQSVVRFLQETSLDDPPEDLEYRVLGEILFPSQPIAPRQVEEAPRWSKIWRRKIRPWLPATIAVAALLTAVVAYGVVRSGSDLSSDGRETAATFADADKAAGAGATPSQSEVLGTASGPTSTAAAATTTSIGSAAISTAPFAPVPAATQDTKTMVRNLRNAQAPAYIAFEPPSSPASGDDQSAQPTTTVPGDTTITDATGTVSPEQVDELVSQMVAFTGMEPLDETRSLGGPTFAAFVPRDDVAQLVDLVRSIGASVRLTVSLAMEPPAVATEAVDTLLERKAELPVLSANRVAQPAVLGYAFTTSTLAPAGGPPDGTSVLVVFYIRR
jgi:anti-sigma factor RsiW